MAACSPELIAEIEAEVRCLVLNNAEQLAKSCLQVCVRRFTESFAAARLELESRHEDEKAELKQQHETIVKTMTLSNVEAKTEEKAEGITDDAALPGSPARQINEVTPTPDEAKGPVHTEIAAKPPSQDVGAEEQKVPMVESASEKCDPASVSVGVSNTIPKTTSKGKGKGKGAPPPPKTPGGAAAPKIMAKAEPKAGLKKGLTFAEERELRFKKQEEKHAQFELGEEDIPEHEKCDAGPMVKCPRCEKEIREVVFQSHWDAHSSEILPWLFLGGQRNAENDKELVERTKITHLLCVAAEASTLPRDIQALGLVQKIIPLLDNDTQDILPHIQEITGFIKSVRDADDNNRVLVYCIQGISRSASSVIAYLMQYENMKLCDAFKHVKERRRVADPRPLFVDALGKWELDLFPDLSKPSLTSAEVVGDRKLLSLSTAEEKQSEKLLIEAQQKEKEKEAVSAEQAVSASGSVTHSEGTVSQEEVSVESKALTLVSKTQLVQLAEEAKALVQPADMRTCSPSKVDPDAAREASEYLGSPGFWTRLLSDSPKCSADLSPQHDPGINLTNEPPVDNSFWNTVAHDSPALPSTVKSVAPTSSEEARPTIQGEAEDRKTILPEVDPTEPPLSAWARPSIPGEAEERKTILPEVDPTEPPPSAWAQPMIPEGAEDRKTILPEVTTDLRPPAAPRTFESCEDEEALEGSFLSCQNEEALAGLPVEAENSVDDERSIVDHDLLEPSVSTAINEEKEGLSKACAEMVEVLEQLRLDRDHWAGKVEQLGGASLVSKCCSTCKELCTLADISNDIANNALHGALTRVNLSSHEVAILMDVDAECEEEQQVFNSWLAGAERVASDLIQESEQLRETAEALLDGGSAG